MARAVKKTPMKSVPWAPAQPPRAPESVESWGVDGIVDAARDGEPIELDAVRLDDLDLTDAALADAGHHGPSPFFGARLGQVTFRSVVLRGMDLREVRLADVAFDSCELSAADLSDADLRRVVFRDCRMSGLVASDTRAEDMRFERCRIDGAWFRAGSWKRVRFVDCDLSGADFASLEATASGFVRCTLDEAEFSKARLTNVAVHGSTFVGLRGVTSWTGVVIDEEQAIPLGLALLAASGIKVADEFLDGDADGEPLPPPQQR
jgi:uncharacterized protein YjbI with pentapeptide repeats